MNAQQVTFVFNLTDDITAPLNTIIEKLGGVEVKTGQVTSKLNLFSSKIQEIGGKAFLWNQIGQAVRSFNDNLTQAIKPGVEFNRTLQELSAITKVTGDALDKVGNNARKTAKIFGLEPAQSLESYKLLLSQLTPELAKTPDVLDKMARNVAILSKQMGGNATSAAEVLTTAMNQYGVDLNNPLEASKEMTRMMNVMSAAAAEGSAELPNIKAAIENSGMAAKMSGVSFEELNASIQTLDKAGKKGSEGGIALRNVLGKLSEGRFLPKTAKDELEAAGIDVNALGDKSKSLTERLSLLKPIMQDTALMTELFGRENKDAAVALIQGIDLTEEYKKKITGTNDAQRQADVIMGSYSEKMKRLNAWFQDIGISIFKVGKYFAPLVGIFTDAIVMFANLKPALSVLTAGLVKINAKLGISTLAVNLFSRSFWVGIYTGIIPSLRALGLAIYNIPIIGWIAAIIAGLIALGTYLYNTSETVRGFFKGLWRFIVTFFQNAGKLFSGLGKIIWGALTFNWSMFSEGLSQIKSIGQKAGQNYQKGFQEGVADIKQKKFNEKIDKEAEKNGLTREEYLAAVKEANSKNITVAQLLSQKNNTGFNADNYNPNSISNNINSLKTTAETTGGNKAEIKNNNIKIDSIIKSLTIQCTTLTEGVQKAKNVVADGLMSVIRDAETIL